jgi:hypothetical protein
MKTERATPCRRLAMFCEATLFEALLPFTALVLAFAIGLGLGITVRGAR